MVEAGLGKLHPRREGTAWQFAVSLAGPGNLGGFRALDFEVTAEQVCLLLIYSRTDFANIPNVEIQRVLRSVMRDSLP